jgi:hypothetical protein
MNEEVVQQLMATAERLATAAESLDRVGSASGLWRGREAIAGARGGAGEIECGLEGAGGTGCAEDAAPDGVGDPG